MGFSLINGVWRVTDGSEQVASSNDQLLHFIPGVTTATVSRPAMEYGSLVSPEIRSTDFAVRALPSNAPVVEGLVRIQFGNGYSPLPNGYWLNFGGTFVLEHKTIQTMSGRYGRFPGSMMFASLYMSGNQLRFREEANLADDKFAGPRTLLASYTLTCRLFSGFFN